LRFGLRQKEHVVIQMFNSQGRVISQLLDETRDAGYYTLPLSSEAQGAYYLDFRAGDFHRTMKIAW
jgi:5-hydroxyisourate hydrolase-like protein (transthyretin family)